ncbi:MAG: SDR family oxidoreductase [Anaerolineales bacterium]|nr:SDR family oxidoreductase [Anaerolineales bacterium]
MGQAYRNYNAANPVRWSVSDRLENPDDIAKAVAFLCSSYADQITGAHLIVSGGLPYHT